MKRLSGSSIGAASAAVVLALLSADRPSAQGCVTALTPNPLVIPASGAATSVNVQTSTGTCQWTVANFPIWLGFPDQGSGVGPGTVTFSHAMPNHMGTPRAAPGTVTIGGLTLPLSQAANPCPLTLSPPTIPMPANGGSSSFTVNTSGQSCAYAVQPSEGVTILSGASGSTFPSTVTFSVGPNTGPEARRLTIVASSLGTFLFATTAVGVEQNGAPIAADAPSTFWFALHRPLNGATHVSPPEIVRITNSEVPSAAWTATSTEPWLVASPGSGNGPGTITLSLDANFLAIYSPGEYTAQVVLASPIAPQTPRRIGIVLRITSATSTTTAPQGVIDIPLSNATGLNGAVAVSGWAVDDVGIRRVQVYRNAVGSEPAGDIYLGDATRVRGARPDIVAAAPQRPEASRAGWGFMILSNMLPGGGNGTFTLSAVAEDIEGQRTVLGQKTVSFDNTNSPFPFGTIDLPAQGGTMSGTYQNQGWILAQPNRFIPFDGSTIRLLIDGVSQPNAALYNNPRPDVASLFPFPPYVNSNGPATQFTIDTTQFTNGPHTIVWVVTDDAGTAQGIGSRFVDVQNASGSFTADILQARSAAEVRAMPPAAAFVWDRKGFDDGAWSLQFAGGRTAEIRQRPGERLEVALSTWWGSRGCGPFAGYQVVGDVAGPLPPGASLDGDQGLFRWLPPTGFAGTFEFVFVRQVCGGRLERIPVRIVIGEK